MDVISRFIATSTILLHVLVILRGQNDLVTAQGKYSESARHNMLTHAAKDGMVSLCSVELAAL